MVGLWSLHGLPGGSASTPWERNDSRFPMHLTMPVHVRRIAAWLLDLRITKITLKKGLGSQVWSIPQPEFFKCKVPLQQQCQQLIPRQCMAPVLPSLYRWMAVGAGWLGSAVTVGLYCCVHQLLADHSRQRMGPWTFHACMDLTPLAWLAFVVMLVVMVVVVLGVMTVLMVMVVLVLWQASWPLSSGPGNLLWAPLCFESSLLLACLQLPQTLSHSSWASLCFCSRLVQRTAWRFCSPHCGCRSFPGCVQSCCCCGRSSGWCAKCQPLGAGRQQRRHWNACGCAMCPPRGDTSCSCSSCRGTCSSRVVA